MFRNYIIVALRHLSRQRVFVLINLLGLALGMAFSILIVLFIRHERSYDQFHQNGPRIYRVAEEASFDKKDMSTLWMPYPLSSWMKEHIPQVEEAIRLVKGSHKLVYNDSVSLPASGFYYADPGFFRMFSFPLIAGNPDSALQHPFTMVITRTTARKYFGGKDPMGQVLKLDNGWSFTVSGICGDVPSNSHFHFDFMASLNGITQAAGIKDDWMNHVSMVYILLKQGRSPKELEQGLQKLVEEKIIPAKAAMLGLSPEKFNAAGNNITYELQPLLSIHLSSHFDSELEPNSSPLYLYIYSIVALLILVVACINFINLGTARSSVRAREIAQRKILGAGKNELIIQFLAEAVVMTFFALFLALVFVELLIQPFNFITGKNLEVFTPENIEFVPWLVAGTILLGILSGLWPAIVLSSFGVGNVLRGKSGFERGGLRFRRILVLVQFSVTILFIICSLTIYQQVHFYQEKNLGFDKKHILVVQRAYALEKQKDKFRESILADPSVIGVSFVTEIPGEVKDNFIIPVKKDTLNSDSAYYIRLTGVDQEYARTMGMQMMAGSFFPETQDTSHELVVINQAAVNQMKLKDPIGKEIFIPAREKKMTEKLKICGIMNDFNYESLRQEIDPLLLYKSSPKEHLQFMLVRFESGNQQKVLDEIHKKWNSFLPGQPFETFFIGDKLDSQYREEKMTARLMGLLSLISILISILGLLGMAFFMADRKVYEIGIRKTMGASTRRIILQLSLEYLKSITLAILIATPVSFIGMYFWLHQFPYHATFNPWTYILAAFGALATGLVTVLYHSVRSATINPALALHYE